MRKGKWAPIEDAVLVHLLDSEDGDLRGACEVLNRSCADVCARAIKLVVFDGDELKAAETLLGRIESRK